MNSYMDDVYRKRAEEEHKLLLTFAAATEKFFDTDSFDDLAKVLDKYRELNKCPNE